LALADALVAHGAEVRVVTRRHDIDPSPWFDRRPKVVLVPLVVPEEATGQGADAMATCASLQAWQPNWVVVDDYGLDAVWHRSVQERLGCRIAAIDDLADRPLEVDLLVDHNLRSDARALYGKVLRRTGTRVLTGPRYALIGATYSDALRWREPERPSVGIFMGGTDPDGASLRVLESLRREGRFSGDVEIVTTSANPGLAQLRSVIAGDGRCRLSVDLPDLAGFFSRHTIQVGAGGGATWERCCIGAPTLAVVVADNQRVVVSTLAAGDVVATVDDVSSSPGPIGQAAARLLADPERRSRMSQAAQQIVDGLGATRVALSILSSSVGVRRACDEDARRVFDWRNHPTTRAVSRSSAPLEWDGHVQWMAGVMADPSRRLYVGMVQARPVGVVRLDLSMPHGDVEVSLFLDPVLQGLGLGPTMLRAAQAAWVAEAVGGVRFVATVLPSNPVSRALFESLDYRWLDGRFVLPIGIH
jgi:UDP-2,4-diacetamido-2,4,6-trideoxy-beta-L-altropyranose hydrolase